MENSGWTAIIDDDPSVLKALARTLDLRGLRTQSYESARAFLSALPDELPTCMIVDLQMPGMTGLELLQHLRSRDIHIPAIVVTAAHADPAARKQCESAGVVTILPKPWPADLLFAAIERAQSSNLRR
jgi:FixJ family two-component response regulator